MPPIPNISKRLEIDDYLGCIKFNGELKFYMSDISDWILNYDKYDPIGVSKNPEFKNGITNVLDDNKQQYVDYMSREEVLIDDIDQYLKSNASELKLELKFYIDFDSNSYVHCIEDIAIEDYLPSDSWKGQFSNPVDFLPEKEALIFRGN